MAITKKQIELDKMKWEKSQEKGSDACGSFDFCVKCDKSIENPCDEAYSKFNAKPAAKKAAAKPAKTVAAKKPAEKKVVEVKATAKTEVAATKAPIAKKPAKKSAK